MFVPLTDEDKGFIRAILDHREELTIWLAYADWLDERADPRAEFLRLTVQRAHLAPEDPGRIAIDQRLSTLRAELDPNWMLVFDDPRIVNCHAGRLWAPCPLSWDRLSPTDEPDIRICHNCGEPVFYCHLVRDARDFVACGELIALSTRVPPAENPFPPTEEIELTLDVDEW